MPDMQSGPLDRLRDVFLKALYEVEDPVTYDNLIKEWNDAIKYCQKIFGR